MPVAPYALVRASIAGGANQTGGITTTAAQTCQLSADPAGLAGATQYLWELIDYPPSFPLPSGWIAQSDGRYTSTAQTPPVFTLDATRWGKYIFRLTLNGGGPAITNHTTIAQAVAIAALVDSSCAVRVLSPNGQPDIGFGETSQFGGRKGWIADLKATLRIIEALLGSSGGILAHSSLTGLTAGDDHTQYELAARTIVAYSGAANTSVLTDARKFITTSHTAANTFTIPPNASVAFGVGTMMFGANIGAGTMTLTAGAGVTLSGSLAVVQYGWWWAKKTATDTWLCFVGSSGGGGAGNIRSDGTVPFAADQSMGGNRVTSAAGVSYGANEYPNADSGTAATIVEANGDAQKLRLTGNCVLTFTRDSKVRWFQVRYYQDGSGGHTLTHPGSITWIGSTPTIGSTPGAELLVGYFDNGTTLYAFGAGGGSGDIKSDGTVPFAAALNMGGFKITNGATPTASTDFVIKSYADALVADLNRPWVRAVATANVTSLSGLAQTFDGTALSVDGQRVLLTGQTTATENGVWLVHSGAWTRPTWFAVGADVSSAFFTVQTGTLYADTIWLCTNNSTSIVGTDVLPFVQITRNGLLIADESTLHLAGLTFAIKAGGVTDNEVNAAAGIAGSKINPNFGSQALTSGKAFLNAAAETSGSPYALRVAGGAHTTLAAGTQSPDVDIVLNRTVQFATGALASQRAVRVTAPTYGFVGASTITDAATVAISGPPVAGTNATLTRTYPLWVESGLARFDGGIVMGGASMAATGTIRGGTAMSIVGLSGGSLDMNLIAFNDSTHQVTIGPANVGGIAGYIYLTSTGISLQVGTNSIITVDTGKAILLPSTSPRWSFAANSTGPSFTQEASATTSAVGNTVIFSSQPTSGSGSTGGTGLFIGGDNSGVGGGGAATGGAFVGRGGDALAGASGTRNGGNAYLRYGRGVTANGNIGLGVDDGDAINFQSMQGGIYIKNASNTPSGTPSGGGFLYISAGALRYRGSAGTDVQVAAA